VKIDNIIVIEQMWRFIRTVLKIITKLVGLATYPFRQPVVFPKRAKLPGTQLILTQDDILVIIQALLKVDTDTLVRTLTHSLINNYYVFEKDGRIYVKILHRTTASFSPTTRTSTEEIDLVWAIHQLKTSRGWVRRSFSLPIVLKFEIDYILYLPLYKIDSSELHHIFHDTNLCLEQLVL